MKPMKVKYIIENFERENFNKNLQNYFSNWNIPPGVLPLENNFNYTVYAIEYTENKFERFYIIDNSGRIHPTSYPSDLFRVVDSRLSKYWDIYINENYPITIKKYPSLFSFKEWRSDPFFEEKMVENINDANKVFKRYRTLMDVEFCNGSY